MTGARVVNPSTAGLEDLLGTPERSRLHQAALDYAAQGIPVFPCIVNGKKPAVGAGGFHLATTDIAQINAWWTARPNYNIGTEPGRRDRLVVDLDTKNGADGIANWGALCAGAPVPSTRTVRTPSGGLHLWFVGQGGITAGKLAAGIDTRGKDGYVLLPPSVIDNNEYTVIENIPCAPLPAFIADKLRSSNASSDKPKGEASDKPGRKAPGRIVLDDPETIRWATAYLQDDIAAYGVPKEGNYSDARTYEIIGTLLDGPQPGHSIKHDTIAELLQRHWAPLTFTREWIKDKTDRAKQKDSAYQNEPGCGPAIIVHDWTPAVDAALAKAASEPIQWPDIAYNIGKVKHIAFPMPQWAVSERILAYRPNIVTGEPGAGKTTMAENEAICVAAGIPLLGAATMPMPVLMLVGEDGIGPVKENLLQMRQTLGVDESVLDRIVCISTLHRDIPGGTWLAHINDAGVVAETRFWAEYVRPMLLAYNGPVLFIVDPADTFVRLDRNSPKPAGAAGRIWGEGICRLNNGQVTLQVNDHPSNKSVETGRHVSGDVQFRASFACTSTLLTKERVVLNGIKQTEYEWQGLRIRYGAEGATRYFRIGDNPTFRLEPAQNLSLAATMARVYKHIEERREQGLRSHANSGNGLDTNRHGPCDMAQALRLPEQYVKAAIKRLIEVGVYVSRKAERTGPNKERDPGGLFPGPLTLMQRLSEWRLDMFVEIARHGPAIIVHPGQEVERLIGNSDDGDGRE